MFTDASVSRKGKFSLAIAALQAFASFEVYDSIIITRPDLVWAGAPRDVSFFFPPSIAWPHPCQAEAWSAWKCVSDLVIVVPGALASTLFSTCDKSFYDDHFHSAHRSYDCATKNSDVRAIFFCGDVKQVIDSRGKPISAIAPPFFLPDSSSHRAEKLSVIQNTSATFDHVVFFADEQQQPPREQQQHR